MNNEEDYMFDDDFETEDTDIENNKELKLEEQPVQNSNESVTSSNFDSFQSATLPDVQTFPSFDIPTIEPIKTEEPSSTETTHNENEGLGAPDFNSFSLNDLPPIEPVESEKLPVETVASNDMNNEQIVTEPQFNYDFDFTKNTENEDSQAVSTNNEPVNNNENVFGVQLNDEPSINENPITTEFNVENNDSELGSPQLEEPANAESINNADNYIREIDYAALGAVLDNESKTELSEINQDAVNEVVPAEFETQEEPVQEEMINNEFEIKEEPTIPKTTEFEIINDNNEMVKIDEEINAPVETLSSGETNAQTDVELDNKANIEENVQIEEIENSQSIDEQVEEPIIKKPSLKLGKLPKIKLNNDQKFMIGLIAFIALSIFLLPYIRAFFNK